MAVPQSINRYKPSRVVGSILFVAVFAFGLSSGLQLRPIAAHADEISALMTEPSLQGQNSEQAQGAAKSDAMDTCLANVPIPSLAPNLHRVVQMVNCSNQTILGSADAAGQPGGALVSVFPREKTWVMGPVGSGANVLTIDIPIAWESTIGAKATGPLFWPRTGCRYDITSGRAQCETGGCGGLYDCSAFKLGPSVGAAITEWTFNEKITNGHGVVDFQDHPDISAVNGANINVDIEQLNGKGDDPLSPGNKNWLASSYPLTEHGQDLRGTNPSSGKPWCPSNFQVLRSDLTQPNFLTKGVIGSVIQGNDLKPIGGDGVVACLSNCARYEYPSVPPGLKGADGQIHAELCDPTDQTSQCYRWKVFCTPLGGAYDQSCLPKQTANVPDCKVTPPVPQEGGVVPIPNYANGAFHGACWIRGLPGNIPPAPRCSGDSFILGLDCPSNICTHPFKDDPSAQPPFGHCSDVVGGDTTACIGDDTVHEVMRKAYTWPNDPQTYAGDASAYRIIFSPGGNPASAPITPAVNTLPHCGELPSLYNIKAWEPTTGLCNNDVRAGAVFAVARPMPSPWSCLLSNGDPTHVPPILPGSGDDGVVCHWVATFFDGEVYDPKSSTYNLTLANKTFFGYYNAATYPLIYHFGPGTGVGGLGYESVYDAYDGSAGVYFYDYGLQAFIYTNPSDFPYFYDFGGVHANHWLYYYNGTSRYFTDTTTNVTFFSAPG
ncbi:MAG: thaumatin family protein [Terriglobales bacterium]